MHLLPRSIICALLVIFSPYLWAQQFYDEAMFDINRTRIGANGPELIHPESIGAGTTVVVVDQDGVNWQDPRFGGCAKPDGALDHRGWVPEGANCKIAWVMCMAVGTSDPLGAENALPIDANHDNVNDAIVPCTYQASTHGTEAAAGVVAVAPGSKIIGLNPPVGNKLTTYPAIYRWLHTPGNAYSSGNSLSNYLLIANPQPGNGPQVDQIWAQAWNNKFQSDSPAEYFNIAAVSGSFELGQFSEHCEVINPVIPQGNSDGDRFLDIQDSCTLVANEVYDAAWKQFINPDGDDDGFGNACDGDLDNNNVGNFSDWGVYTKARDLNALIAAKVPGTDARYLRRFYCSSGSTYVCANTVHPSFATFEPLTLQDQDAFNAAFCAGGGCSANFDVNGDNAVNDADERAMLAADIDWDKDIDSVDGNLVWTLMWQTSGPSYSGFNSQANVAQNLRVKKYVQDVMVNNRSFGNDKQIHLAPYYNLGAEIAALEQLGVTTVFAAGNDPAANSIGYPACMNDAVAVSGVRARGADGHLIGTEPSGSSSSPTLITVASPSSSSIIDGQRVTGAATSYATPVVAGSVAVIQSAWVEQHATPLSTQQVVARLRQTRRQARDNRLCSDLPDRSSAIGCVAQPNGNSTTWLGSPNYALPLLDLNEALKESSAYSGDADNDGIFNEIDNCVHYANPDQRDSDGDGYGTTCDADLAGPNLPGTAPYQFNWYGDGIANWTDAQTLYSMLGTDNPHGNFNGDVDANGNAIVDSADMNILTAGGVRPPGYYSGSSLRSGLDADQDGSPYSADRCLDVPNGPWVNSATGNPAQFDSDNDGYGNICDADFDNDDVVTWYDHMLVGVAVQNGNGDSVYDVTGDGVVNQADVDKVAQLKLINAVPGPSGMTH